MDSLYWKTLLKWMIWGKKPTIFGNIHSVPIPSMYGIFTYIYHENQPNVGKYTIHGWYGVYSSKGLCQTSPEDAVKFFLRRSGSRPWAGMYDGSVGMSG